MDFFQQAAGKYLGSEDKPAAAGTGGGLDWSHLSTLAGQYQDLDANKDGKMDVSDFKNYFGYGKPAVQQPSAQEGQPPPGYPSQQSADPNVINQLLAKFTKENDGQQFTGEDHQYDKLLGIAQRVTGTDIPLPVLKRLIKWKLGGQF